MKNLRLISQDFSILTSDLLIIFFVINLLDKTWLLLFAFKNKCTNQRILVFSDVFTIKSYK